MDALQREELIADIDQRVAFQATWSDFESFLAIRGDAPRPRLTYLDGTLELMSPSRSHEGIKKRLARLLELWSMQRGVPLAGYGSTTLKKQRRLVGVEPDECYVVGRSDMPNMPDLAIEIDWTSGGIEKLEVYHRLGVAEVWFWRDDRLLIFKRSTKGYLRRKRSALLPTLDVQMFERHVAQPDQLRAIESFMAALRSH